MNEEMMFQQLDFYRHLNGWKLQPPSLIKKSLQSKLDQPVAAPFSTPGIVEFATAGETLNFTLYHEGQHTGFIKALIKAVSL